MTSGVWIVESHGRSGGPKDGQFAQVITPDDDRAHQAEASMRQQGGRDVIVSVQRIEVTP